MFWEVAVHVAKQPGSDEELRFCFDYQEPKDRLLVETRLGIEPEPSQIPKLRILIPNCRASAYATLAVTRTSFAAYDPVLHPSKMNQFCPFIGFKFQLISPKYFLMS